MKYGIQKGGTFRQRQAVALCRLETFRWNRGMNVAIVAEALCQGNNAANHYYVHLHAD